MLYSSEGDAGGMEHAMKALLGNQLLSFSEYEKIAGEYQTPVYIPVYMVVPEPLADPAGIYAAISPEKGFLLESMEGVPKRAVRSIIGTSPLAILSLSDSLEMSGEHADIFCPDPEILRSGSPLDILKEMTGIISGYSPDGCSFSGGMAGYCRYDLVTDITGGMVQAAQEDGPKIRFLVPGELIVFDHVTHSCMLIAGTIVSPGENLEESYARAIKKIAALQDYLNSTPVRSNQQVSAPERISLPDDDRQAYEDAVGTALEHIRAGNIFQVVLSRRFSLRFEDDPFRIYEVLRLINPSPYLYYFNFGDEAVIGSSPEMLVKTEGSTVTTVPIAGTRPRGKDAAEDEKLASDLRTDPKERAEHLMLVDLARNDIGRVSEFGTVRVTDYMMVEKFSHVQHLTSVVTGELKSSLQPVDALEACFPAGTVSGAPKIRAMQIIGELEQVPRGLYSGAVGYIGFNGLMEFAIAIRTVIVRDGRAICQAGAGIVADSVPSVEFDETQAKASAMAQAVYAAGGFL